jgi:hypothetical protein
MQSKFLLTGLLFFMISCHPGPAPETAEPIRLSGIYPHLAYYNHENECGTGAVVPWADRLWVITYGPHLPFGSSDQLYEITPDLRQIARPESIGGTPANRMIHLESGQLFIGPYAIDSTRNVRVIPYTQMPGRHTGIARHLTDPANKIYYGTMEEGFYEVDVHTLGVTMLYEDANVGRQRGEDTGVNPPGMLLPGAHGKGLYSGQGVLVYSNNGEATPEALERFDIGAGALAEWDGRHWTVVRRNQFVEVTGPGGLYGNPNPATDPIWATGWDHKSLLLGVREAAEGRWHFYRLPKASHSYDGAHGWNTEWPRIRDVGPEGQPDYLMTMHGLFWKFPGTFSADNATGIRPRSAYLKVIGDFARWRDELVFGCDDSAQKEFLNTRLAKGGIGGPGQSNSNLWFAAPDTPDRLGPATAGGAVWLSEPVAAGQPSEPFLFAGWPQRMAWLRNEGREAVRFSIEIDRAGRGDWVLRSAHSLAPGQTLALAFEPGEAGEWIRVTADRSTRATVWFSWTGGRPAPEDGSGLFGGVARAGEGTHSGGLLYALGGDRRALGILAGDIGADGFRETGYYQLDERMRLTRVDDPETADTIRRKFAIPAGVIAIDSASVLIVDDKGRRWRLPKGPGTFDRLHQNNQLRVCREVATERDLFHAHGTFYELPAENAGGFAVIRPVASHPYAIHDYASYRGLLVMTGIGKEADGNPDIFTSADGWARVWAGAIDDLWKLGKPVGTGGPWNDTEVRTGEPSDPYLIGFYDQRHLALTHDSDREVTFTLEADPLGHGLWMEYLTATVPPGGRFEHTFPAAFQARWIRLSANRDCRATVWLTYR